MHADNGYRKGNWVAGQGKMSGDRSGRIAEQATGNGSKMGHLLRDRSLLMNPATAIILLTLAAYLPVRRAGFIWDDAVLITQCPLIKAPDGLWRLWVPGQATDCVPLTQTTFWLEWRLWGMDAAGYHAANVLLHVLNGLLLWRVLNRLKVPGAWLSALLFGVHPVNVASVAWIAERKNTLSMLFYLLAILCYLRFNERRVWRWYALSLFAFFLALASKASVVILPFVLLGCVGWLRGKIRFKDVLRMVPFFALSVIMGLMALSRQHGGQAGIPTPPFLSRLAGAGWAMWFYVFKALLPVHTSMVYPRWEVDEGSLLSYVPGAALVAIFWLLWRYRRSGGRGALFGLGYLVVTLGPVLGLVRLNFMAFSRVADHWQYLAVTGTIALVVGVLTQAARRWRAPERKAATAAAGVVVGVFCVLTWTQSRNYRDPLTLWRATVLENPTSYVSQRELGVALVEYGRSRAGIDHLYEALRRNPKDAVSRNCLGNALYKEGRLEEAAQHFQKALEFAPRYADAHIGLATVLVAQGKMQEAIAHYGKAGPLDPNYAFAQKNLGLVLARLGNLTEAIEHFREAIRIEPENADSHNNLGTVLAEQGNLDEAIGQFREALRLEPEYADAQGNLGAALRLAPDDARAHKNLADALLNTGRAGEAIAHYRATVTLSPNWPAALNGLARVLATQRDAKLRNGAEAVRLAERACELTQRRNASFLDTLAAAYAEEGRFSEAVKTAQEAQEIAAASGNKELAETIGKRLLLYRSNQPFRED